MSPRDEAAPDGDAGVPPSATPAAVRAQLLATEHWSLLASRSTTQGEVLTRISMFLTFTSASLLSAALVGQATRFSDTFITFGIVVLCIDLAIGLLTQIRVMNVGMEDLMYVIAMNRLRAAYVELDPGLARYLMAEYHDDEAGSMKTYDFLGGSTTFRHVAGSSMTFITAVNAALIALLLGTVLVLPGVPLPLAIPLAAVGGLAFAGWSLAQGYRRYSATWRNFTPLSPTPPEGA
ncbi:hypothetical protein BIU82_12710 [Arthrobacter sp. SW1]|uniref:hypothetical protein n=1 Tax=Arthrobacter sp. SW1 TaxID=1920889 RepID=UPI000877B560|nr:hypothetical protein [Arthrobacter sp. SW1]OFI36620.1 hypothetical protein BIU82_12710 [Arthrobacter sp. SW1]